jgi:error-prone DNA polymerase
MKLYESIRKLPRHLGQHSGGMVICAGRLDSIVPIEPATMPNRFVVQWDKDDCANMGIIKIDLLGLGMMAVLEDSITLIKESYKEDVDLAHLPQNDPQVYSALQQADTIGMFQVESRAQMSSLPRIRPNKFYDIVVQVALIRPGPIVGKMVHPYIRRRQGLEQPDYMHDDLKPILKRTLGVPLFQEQLLRMAMVCAGFTGGEAEELRRALGSKRSHERMEEIEEKLRQGMQKKGIDPDTQDKIVLSVSSFAEFGFPESHAASFALLAYASAYLKCHYLAAFMAAMLNNYPLGFYSPATLVKDAQRHGLHFKPIDITRSDWLCTIEEYDGEKWLRLGIRYAKGVRKESALAIMAARHKEPFAGIDDLYQRVPGLRKNEIRTLAEIGALNSIEGNGSHRRTALWQVEAAMRSSGPLFEKIVNNQTEGPLPRMSNEELLNTDLSRTGLNIGRHPMSFHREEMDKIGAIRAVDLGAYRNNQFVTIAGLVIVRQRPGTASGFVFLSMEDETGVMNVIVTPNFFRENHVKLVGYPYLIIEGVLQNYDNVVSVKASKVTPLISPTAFVKSHDFH